MMSTRAVPGGIMGLRDTKHVGHADVRERFSTGYATSEVRLFDNHLYTEAFLHGRQRQPALQVVDAAVLRRRSPFFAIHSRPASSRRRAHRTRSFEACRVSQGIRRVTS